MTLAKICVGDDRPRPALVLLALAAMSAAAVSFSPASAQTPSGSPERGQRLFAEKMCYTCHGTVGQGGERGSGPRLVPNLWPYAAFAQQVRHPRQDMPRYPLQFVSDAELADMYAYLTAIKPGPRAAELAPLRDRELPPPCAGNP